VRLSRGSPVWDYLQQFEPQQGAPVDFEDFSVFVTRLFSQSENFDILISLMVV